jgi:plastocyanin
MRFTVFLLAVASLAAPTAASAQEQSMSILATAYGAPRVDVLAGDTVTWRNASVRTHTVAAADGSAAATATVEAGGAFHATVTPRTRGRRAVVSTRVVPGSKGATVVLQLRLRDRFGWWPVRRARLDGASRARFSLRLRHAVRARVVLTASDGATPLARSVPLRLAPR